MSYKKRYLLATKTSLSSDLPNRNLFTDRNDNGGESANASDMCERLVNTLTKLSLERNPAHWLRFFESDQCLTKIGQKTQTSSTGCMGKTHVNSLRLPLRVFTGEKTTRPTSYNSITFTFMLLFLSLPPQILY